MSSPFGFVQRTTAAMFPASEALATIERMTRLLALASLFAIGCSCGTDATPDSGTDVDSGPRADANIMRVDSGPAPCGADPVPPGTGECPAACNGGCTPENVCLIDCPSAMCNDRTITCPQGYDCRIDCHGLDACDTSTIQCPDQYRCTVLCDQYDSCGDVNLVCTDGWCDMQCGANGPPCGGSTQQCGTGACTASCGTTDTLTVACGSACVCTSC
jgi:hypothetical protein